MKCIGRKGKSRECHKTQPLSWLNDIRLFCSTALFFFFFFFFFTGGGVIYLHSFKYPNVTCNSDFFLVSCVRLIWSDTQLSTTNDQLQTSFVKHY